jgi:hypothetical protein
VNVPLRCIVAFALLAAAPAELACGGSDDETTRKEQLREVQIQSLAAYSCMPESLRRELRRLEKRHDARVKAIYRASQPKGATGGTTAPAGFQQLVERDHVRLRLLRRAQTIYRSYSPGGRDYEAGCYLREREKARSRLEGT